VKLRQNDPPRQSPRGAEVPVHFPMDDERHSRTLKFRLQMEEDGTPRVVTGYFTVGMYADGTPGEVHIDSNKEGDGIRGLARSWSIAISMLLQYGVPPQVIYDKFKWRAFQPDGISGVEGVPLVKSIVDLVVRWMELKLPPTAGDATEKDQGWLGMVEEVSLNLSPAEDGD